MFNIGPLELMVILLVALVVVGPERLPELGRTIGRGLREFRKAQDELRDTLKFDLDEEPVGVGALGGWFLFGAFLRIVQLPFCRYVMAQPPSSRPPTGCRLILSGPLDPFVVKLKVVVFLGLFIALPVVLYQLWAFVVPGLTQRERRMAFPFIGSSVLLFALGALVAFITLPNGVNFLLCFARRRG